MVVAAAIIAVFYTVGSSAWSNNDLYYEGAFCLLAAIIITIMGAALLRIGKMQDKWRVKLAKAVNSPITDKTTRGRLAHLLEKYSMFFLPFITVLREGIEAVVFVAGVSFSAPATSVPLPVVVGLIVGGIVGYIMYRSGAGAKLQVFLVISTCLLYLVGAGLFSRAVWSFEQQAWNKLVGGDAAEAGAGPGSYDIDRSVWHVNVSTRATSLFVCCTCLLILSCSAVRPKPPTAKLGVSSTPFSAGPTRPLTAPSSRTTSTGSLSWLALSSCASASPLAAGPS